jgi:hypothetical protein
MQIIIIKKFPNILSSVEFTNLHVFLITSIAPSYRPMLYWSYTVEQIFWFLKMLMIKIRRSTSLNFKVIKGKWNKFCFSKSAFIAHLKTCPYNLIWVCCAACKYFRQRRHHYVLNGALENKTQKYTSNSNCPIKRPYFYHVMGCFFRVFRFRKWDIFCISL